MTKGEVINGYTEDLEEKRRKRRKRRKKSTGDTNVS